VLHRARRRGEHAPGKPVKIVVTGPFAAGKTTFITTLSDIPVLATERRVSDFSEGVKDQTTVAMDFGRITVAGDLVMHLYGTPGQKRFDFMWQILAEGMLGFIVLVDVHDEPSLTKASDILRFFIDTADVPFVVGVNKSEGDPDGAARCAREALGLPASARVVACDVRDRTSAKGLLVELLYAVLADLDARVPATAS
jgi:signal recognition particle receptor subunit beta